MADWLAIEGAYRAGIKSVREIADEYGSAFSTIRNRAKKAGWVRDPAGTKRQIVSNRMSGIAQGAAQLAMSQIEAAAIQDAEDMNTGLSVCRRVLRAMDAIEGLTPPSAKQVMEATEKAIACIRTIRELNAPGLTSAGSNGPILIQVVAVGAQNNEP